MRDEARLQLMRDQSALIRTLVQSGTAPAGFDTDRLQIAAQALVHKRMRSVARHCPNLAAALADQFSILFSLYAEGNAKPNNNSSKSDEHEFARFLVNRDALPEAARMEAAKVVASGIRGQRGFLWRICPTLFMRVFFMRVLCRIRELVSPCTGKMP